MMVRVQHLVCTQSLYCSCSFGGASSHFVMCSFRQTLL